MVSILNRQYQWQHILRQPKLRSDSVVVTAVSHTECVMRVKQLREAAHTGLGRSPPAGVCRLTDSSALVYHTAAAVGGGGSAELATRLSTLLFTDLLYCCYNRNKNTLKINFNRLYKRRHATLSFQHCK